MANGTPQILLPWDNAAVFQTNLEGYSGGRLASWTVWVAPTTMRAADAAKKVGMGESEFRAINNIPAHMVIKPGSALLVPRSAHIEQDVAGRVADSGQMSLAPEVVLKRTTVKAMKGDTVTTMARKYNVTPANVAQWNGVSASASFNPKQQVVLYLPATTGKKSSVKAQPTKNNKKK